MEAVIIGAVIYVLTALSKYLYAKFNLNVSAKSIVVFFSLLAGAIYYQINKTDPALIEEVSTFVLGAFGVSQAIRMFLDSILKLSGADPKK